MVEPPPDVTPEVFRRWRDARRGAFAGEDLSNPYWSWLIRAEQSAYGANQHFGGPSSFGGKPAWSADRFGQSETELPDGRRVLIAGEHEDYYDPDFFIYNDIILWAPDDTLTILGYPEEVFPPTDFHSATLVGGELVLVGSLAYPKQRRLGETAIVRVTVDGWRVDVQGSDGEGPGWIHRHEATLEDGSLRITGGLVEVDETGRLMENIDDYRLWLDDWRWERLTERDWPLWELRRLDGKRNELWEMRQWLWNQEHDSGSGVEYPEPHDRRALEELYLPATAHESLDSDEYDITRVEVAGVVVRYQEGFEAVTMSVEGALPGATIAELRDELRSKLQKATGEPWGAAQLRGSPTE